MRGVNSISCVVTFTMHNAEMDSVSCAPIHSRRSVAMCCRRAVCENRIWLVLASCELTMSVTNAASDIDSVGSTVGSRAIAGPSCFCQLNT